MTYALPKPSPDGPWELLTANLPEGDTTAFTIFLITRFYFNQGYSSLLRLPFCYGIQSQVARATFCRIMPNDNAIVKWGIYIFNY